jgi:nucleotide-binding universal stress UspA family protein
MFDSILIAHDGSDGAQKAFDAALELALRYQAKLHMISVEEDLPRYAETVAEVSEASEEASRYFGQLAEHAKRRAAMRSVELECTIVAGHEVKAIVDFVRARGFRLLVVGFTGHSRIHDSLWGGTSQNLARLAPCSVLVVK